MTTAEQLEINVLVLGESIRRGIVGEPLIPMIETLSDHLDRSLEQGDQVWVVETMHRLTTTLQVLNAIVQGYQLWVVPFDRSRLEQVRPNA